MNIFLSPSLLSADFTRVGEQLSLLEEAGVPYLHLDVMDGICAEYFLWHACHPEHSQGKQNGV